MLEINLLGNIQDAQYMQVEVYNTETQQAEVMTLLEVLNLIKEVTKNYESR